ncbi:phosphomevalonate kinase-like [Pyrus ussuriensis x Pyrus communis]|uniref:phosphomevalonate kinase n=1 Tax=Pyrus ussuriensis x Pyrus communis TaxID=2448454 RepID=A0A5N5GAP0_9ROSA|nr:phosphomevalonate kinase-like [Pyrus ussuriensis x Pyrus communis]
MEAVVASAPGKVLLTGGYLILERPNAGLVLSTNARFFAIVKPLYQPLKPDSWAWGWTDVKLTSPQLGRESIYKLSLKNLSLDYVSSGDSRNPFVEQAVQYCVAAARATVDKKNKDSLEKLLLHGFDITILGSNDFYSYRNQIEARGLPLTPDALAALPPFASITFNDEGSNVKNCKPEVAKTGLGSSAAMTTAVVAALLHYLGVVDLSSMRKDHQHEKHTADLDLVHVIAQTAHCIAQGKVGSGFDVSSAVYGSQRYVRFSPEVISSAQVAVTGTPLQEVVPQILKGKWDHDRTKFSLPPLMTLLLGEPGTGGSSTPSMVGAVKKWQKSDPQKSLETWKKLSEANLSLEMQLNTLSKLAEEHWEEYKNLINSCSILKSEKWTQQVTTPNQEIIVKALLGARDAMLGIRYHMHQMGEAAGVPIEPESQTKLLDATMRMEGVLLAGVPGAGGFDAVFAVTLGDAGSHVSNSWSSFNVLALLVREDPQGVSLENADPRTKAITSSISSVNIE